MIPIRDDLRAVRPTPVNWAIILTCVGVFIWQTVQPGQGIEHAFIPAALRSPRAWAHPWSMLVWPMIASTFMHGGPLHLAGNMLYLWVFGDNVEARIGSLKYIVFYLVCGFAANVTHAFLTNMPYQPVVGASGAISGVLGAYYVLFPGARVKVWIPIGLVGAVGYVRASVLLGLWFALQAISALFSFAARYHVAFWAHVGGFVAGYIIARFLIRRSRPGGFQRPRIVRVIFR